MVLEIKKNRREFGKLRLGNNGDPWKAKQGCLIMEGERKKKEGRWCLLRKSPKLNALASAHF